MSGLPDDIARNTVTGRYLRVSKWHARLHARLHGRVVLGRGVPVSRVRICRLNPEHAGSE